MKVLNNIAGKLSVLIVLCAGTTIAFAEDIKAHVNWAQKVDLRIPVTGIITKVNISRGQIVKKNELLVQMDQRTFRANVQHWKAEVSARQSEYEEAERELERFQSLYDRTMLSDHELQVAKNHVTATKSALVKAKSGLTNAKVELEVSALRAPFNAIVLHKNVELGQAVVIGEGQAPLLTLASSDKRIATATVDRAQSALFRIGDEVNVKIGNDVIPAKIVEMSFNANKINTVSIVAQFNAGNNDLMPGSEVTIITK